MIVAACQHETTVKCGKHASGSQRIRCKLCGKYLVEETVKPIGEMRISMRDAALAIKLLVKGMSVRDTADVVGVHRDTVCDLILVVGENCARLLESKVKGIAAKDVQVDELWSFVGCKEKMRVKRGYSEELGDSYTFIGIDRETKLVLAHRVGKRDTATCEAFLKQLNRATVDRFQLSTDGFNGYTLGVPFEFGSRVDFAQLIKTYASQQEVTRYSPAKIISAEKLPRFGNPNPDKICTSHVERFNLTLRMGCRRHTRLTNAHSKSLKHHVAMQAIALAHYNFCRKHMTIKKTPAMAAGLADKVWTIREMLENAAKA
jgi:transposase-like protein/IS1 family transposase